MKKSEILEIRELNNQECSVTYKVLNKRKNVIYQKDSQKLIDCINKYIYSLECKKKKIITKNDLCITKKRIILYIIVYIITLFLVYLILYNSLQKFTVINDISYFISLLLITISFIVVHCFNYKNDVILEEEHSNITNEIMMVEKIKSNCLELVSAKNRKEAV